MHLKDIQYGGLANVGAKAHLLKDKLPPICVIYLKITFSLQIRVLIYETQIRQYEATILP